jgi:PBP1b-binding outer membrane lipoprotein LpoB
MMMLVSMLLGIAGCTTHVSRAQNKPGRASVYSDAATPGQIQGVGIESQDIISMTDKMMRDMLANPLLVSNAQPRRVIVDAAYFHNESSNQINVNLLTDRLRTGLLQAANGRMIFLGRHYADMVEHERKLKSQGVVDGGTNTAAPSPMGGDYRLGGRITSLDTYGNTLDSRFTQVVFEMVDLQTGAIVWGGQYSFKKTAEPNVFYR